MAVILVLQCGHVTPFKFCLLANSLNTHNKIFTYTPIFTEHRSQDIFEIQIRSNWLKFLHSPSQIMASMKQLQLLFLRVIFLLQIIILHCFARTLYGHFSSIWTLSTLYGQASHSIWTKGNFEGILMNRVSNSTNVGI